MLSNQKSSTDKIGLGYVAHPSNIPSTSRTVFVKLAVPEPSPTVEDKGKDKINGNVPGTQKPPSIKKFPICHHYGLSGHVPPQCSLLKAQRAKVKKEVSDKKIMAQDLYPSIRLHGIRILTKLHGIKLQGIRLLIKPHGIKTLGIMPESARLLNISGLSRDLFLPIIVANPSSTNPSISKSHRRWKVIYTAGSHLFRCKT
jgi:hypothetical protein